MARHAKDPEAVEVEIGRLADLDLAALRQRWQQLYGNPPPKSLRRKFLVKAVAYGIQVKAFGGLKPATKRRLRAIADAVREGTVDAALAVPRIKPGVRLVRAWKDKTHVVTVLAGGEYEWNGKRYRSLSAIARAITGTSWNGHTFFGLKKAPTGRAREAAEGADGAAAPPLAADGDAEAPVESVATAELAPVQSADTPTEPEAAHG